MNPCAGTKKANKYLTDILKEQGLPLEEKADWNGHRENFHAFRNMSEEEKNAYIQANPAFGKVVCRCETVTEGEILQAIRTNPRATDMDGVKRRTRSGMGRCQGGFCGSKVVEILARELGVPMNEITKFGGESKIMYDRTK